MRGLLFHVNRERLSSAHGAYTPAATSACRQARTRGVLPVYCMRVSTFVAYIQSIWHAFTLSWGHLVPVGLCNLDRSLLLLFQLTQSAHQTGAILHVGNVVVVRTLRASFAVLSQPLSTVNETASLTFLSLASERSDAASKHPKRFEVSVAFCSGGSR